jgi:hypothetical protein
VLGLKVLLVASLAVAGAAIAWLAVRDEPPMHARQIAFVIRPGPAIDASQVPDAVRGVSQSSSELVFTIARVVETEPFRHPPGPGLGRGYSIEASVPPATNVVHVRVAGPDADVLRRFQTGYAAFAADWVKRAYPAYRLEFLEGKAVPDLTRRSELERIGLAGLLGVFVGLLVLFAGAKLGRREPPLAAVVHQNGHATSSHQPFEHGAAGRSARV